MTKLRKQTHLKANLPQGKKIHMLLAGLGSVRIVRNCDLGLENAALGLQLRAAFSRLQSQFFTIRTSQPADNIYIFYLLSQLILGTSVEIIWSFKP